MRLIVHPEVRQDTPLREPTDGHIAPSQIFHVFCPLLQMLLRNDLMPIIPLQLVLPDLGIGAELTRIGMTHALLVRGIDDRGLEVVAEVAERHDNGVETSVQLWIRMCRGRHCLESCDREHSNDGIFLCGRPRGVVEDSEAGKAVFQLKKLEAKGVANVACRVDDEDGLESCISRC